MSKFDKPEQPITFQQRVSKVKEALYNCQANGHEYDRTSKGLYNELVEHGVISVNHANRFVWQSAVECVLDNEEYK